MCGLQQGGQNAVAGDSLNRRAVEAERDSLALPRGDTAKLAPGCGI